MFNFFAHFSRVAAPPLHFSADRLLPGLEPTHRFSRASVQFLNETPQTASIEIQERQSGKRAQLLQYKLTNESYLQFVAETEKAGLPIQKSGLLAAPRKIVYSEMARVLKPVG